MLDSSATDADKHAALVTACNTHSEQVQREREERRAARDARRRWRSASEHQDEQRWAREGPRDAEAAAQHIMALDARLRELESGP